MLKFWIAFLARLVHLAVLIEATYGKPCTISRGLTSLGIEARSKGILFSQLSTIALQIVLGDTTPPAPIHPQTKTLIADELCDAYRFINGGILLCVASNFVLEDQHASCPFTFSLLY